MNNDISSDASCCLSFFFSYKKLKIMYHDLDVLKNVQAAVYMTDVAFKNRQCP